MRSTIARFLILAVGASAFYATAAPSVLTNRVVLVSQQSPAHEEQRNEAGVATGSIPNARLVDQDRKTRMFRELLNDKVVVINFIYSSCAAYCGMQAANFSRLQKLLARKGASGLVLISITTDPKNDTPSRLRHWAEKLGWKPGWLLLTGTPDEVEPLLVALTGDRGGSGVHSTVALIGNASSGKWIRTDALAPPHTLAAMIDEVRTPKPPTQ